MARAKGALAGLPWVDQKSVTADVQIEEVRFVVSDMSKFDEEQLKDAFKRKKFDSIKVLSKTKA